MIVISGVFEIAEAALPAALAAATGMCERTRLERGCTSYVISQSPENTQRLHLFEEWDSEEALSAHFATDSFAAFAAALPGLLVAPPVMLRYEIADRRPLFAGA